MNVMWYMKGCWQIIYTTRIWKLLSLFFGCNSKDDGAVAYDVVWSDAPTSRFTLYYLYINLNGCERSTGRPRVNIKMI